MELKEAVDQLTGLIQSLASSVDAVKEKTEKNEEAIAAFKEASQRGFPIPTVNAPIPTEVPVSQVKEYLAPYEMSIQGSRLMDKIVHPIHTISDTKRLELAEYFITFLKAGVFQEPAARQLFLEKYGRAGKGVVDVGDPGNVFPVPDVLMTEILAFAREKSTILKYGRLWNMTSEKQSFPAETAGSATVYWGNTTEEATPVIGEVELEAEELSSYAAVKNTTLADALTDVVSWLTEVMAEAAGLELDNQAFNGDGTICYGILSSTCGNTVYQGGASNSTKDAFSDLAYTDISAMIAKLPGLRKVGARFFMSGDVLHYVRTLKDASNNPIFIDPIGFDVPARIYGYPFEEVVKMPTASAAATAFMAFGNPQYFAVGRRLQSGALQINPYDQWKQNRTLFKIYQRWALKMAMPDGFVRLLTSTT